MFREVYGLLYEQNQSWTQSSNPNEAICSLIKGSDIQINIDQLREDSSAVNTANVIRAHIQSGKELGVNRTPSFYIDGEKIELRSVEEFRQLIDVTVRANASN